MLMMRRCFCVSLRSRPADAHDAALFLRVPKGSTGCCAPCFAHYFEVDGLMLTMLAFLCNG